MRPKRRRERVLWLEAIWRAWLRHGDPECWTAELQRQFSPREHSKRSRRKGAGG
jgi:hypothetical protein